MPQLCLALNVGLYSVTGKLSQLHSYRKAEDKHIVLSGHGGSASESLLDIGTLRTPVSEPESNSRVALRKRRCGWVCELTLTSWVVSSKWLNLSVLLFLVGKIER